MSNSKIVLALFYLSLPVLLTIWKVFYVDISFYEMWPVFLFELLIVLVVIVLTCTINFNNKIVWGVLLTVFWSYFISDNLNDVKEDWLIYTGIIIISYIVLVFTNLGGRLRNVVTQFPSLFSDMIQAHFFLKIFPYIIFPCYIFFFRVPMALMEKDEIQSYFKEKDPRISAQHFLHLGVGFDDNHFIGSERFGRMMYYEDDSLTERFKKIEKLSISTNEQLENLGVYYADFKDIPLCNWADIYYKRVNKNEMIFCTERLKGYRKEEKDGRYYISYLKVDTFKIRTKLCSDSNYRVVDFPEKLNISLVEHTDTRMNNY